MKILIVNYSYTGNNDLLSERIQKELNADLFHIKELRKRTKFSTFLDVTFRRNPKIFPFDGSLENYDLIIFTAPLWFGTIAFPLRTFLIRHKSTIKNYAFISICGFKGNEKFEADLKKYTGKEPLTLEELPITALLPEGQTEAPDYRVKHEEIEKFKSSIEGDFS